MALSKRLETLINTVKKTDTVVDIGTDHGLLLIELVKRGIISHGIGIDNKPRPLEKARRNISKEGLSKEIILILSDGAKNLTHQSDTWVIAGIGAENMIEILGESLELVKKLNQLVLSPHSKPELIRLQMAQWGFSIDSEEVVFDDKYYLVFSYHYTGQPQDLSLREEILGTLKKNESTVSYLRYLLTHYQFIYNAQTVKEKRIAEVIELLNQELMKD